MIQTSPSYDSWKLSDGESDTAQRLADAATHAADCVSSDLGDFGVAVEVDGYDVEGVVVFSVGIDHYRRMVCTPDELLECVRDWFARGVKKCNYLMSGDKGTEACRLLLSTIEGETYGLSEAEQLAAIRAAACAAKELIES